MYLGIFYLALCIDWIDCWRRYPRPAPCPGHAQAKPMPCREEAQRQQGSKAQAGRQAGRKAPPSPLAPFHPQGKAQAYPAPRKPTSACYSSREENRHPLPRNPAPAQPAPQGQQGPASQQGYGVRSCSWIRTTPLRYAVQD